MKLQIIWFCTASFTSFSVFSTGLVNNTAQQLWNPEIAQAAKITTTLLRNKPRLFSLTGRPVSRSTRSAARYSLVPDETHFSKSL
jgi:hypothetical protein